MSLDEMIADMLCRTAPGSGSNYGGMCERMASLLIVGYPCGRCDGAGIVALDPKDLAKWRVRIADAKLPVDRDELRRQLSLESSCKVCRGSGFIEGHLAHVAIDSMFTTTRCGKCRGSGETFPPNDMTAEFEDVCQRCGGDMYVVPITVRSTGSSKSGRQPRNAVDPGDDSGPAPAGGSGEVTAAYVDESAMLEFGRASSVLEELKRSDPPAAAAVAAFCGPAGDTWGKHRWGRLFALWPLTKPGKRLLHLGLSRSVADVRHLLDPLQVLATERETSERDHDDPANDDRRRQVGHADRAARELWQHAQAVLRGAT